MANAATQVMVVSSDRVVFDGPAMSVTLPGERGAFEVLPLHRPLVSRLLAGMVVIDGRSIAILRGVARVADDIVTAVVELRE